MNRNPNTRSTNPKPSTELEILFFTNSKTVAEEKENRMVEMLMACEQTHSLLLWAAMLNADGDADARKAISALKYQIGTAGRMVAQEAVQIHGGMGVTWELDISHYFKRFTAIELLFGTADFHLNRYLEPVS